MPEVDTAAVRCLLLPLVGGQALLPEATVAQVVDYVEPTPLPGAPAWLAGESTWAGTSFPVLILDGEPPGAGGKPYLVVVRASGQYADLPFLGILARGLPRQVEASRTNLVARRDAIRQRFARAAVTLAGEEAFIPDLDWLEQSVAGARGPDSDPEEGRAEE
jgi:chemosensory pili system protein ChpC